MRILYLEPLTSPGTKKKQYLENTPITALFSSVNAEPSKQNH